MKSILVSALALSAMTTVALAQPVTPADDPLVPVKLTNAQMDRVTAGEPPKDVQKDQAKRGDYPFGQRNAGKCENNGQCKQEFGD